MLSAVWMVARNKGVDRFQFVNETMGHQKIQRTVDRGWSIGADILTLAYPFQQFICLHWLASVSNQLQYVGADRCQA